jgi:proteic killer suppression protein
VSAPRHRLDDLLVPPSNRLEKLKGNLKGFFLIRINNQWRVILKWIDVMLMRFE